ITHRRWVGLESAGRQDDGAGSKDILRPAVHFDVDAHDRPGRGIQEEPASARTEADRDASLVGGVHEQSVEVAVTPGSAHMAVAAMTVRSVDLWVLGRHLADGHLAAEVLDPAIQIGRVPSPGLNHRVIDREWPTEVAQKDGAA